MAYLALRHTSPPGVLPRAFAWLTRQRLVTKYPHAGIVIGNTLYEATFKYGVRSTKFNPEGWELFQIHNTDENDLIERFNLVEGCSYDWFSLLAFVIPFRSSMAQWFYCYELCGYMLDGDTSRQRVTPETLLTGL